MPRTRDVLTWVPVMAALAALVRMDAAAPQPAGTSALPDTAQVFRTAVATIRVSAIKGLVYPWALAFLPNGDMLVTEQGRNTLRLIRKGPDGLLYLTTDMPDGAILRIEPVAEP